MVLEYRQADGRFDAYLSAFTWWNIGLSAIFNSPEAISDIALMATVPTLLPFIVYDLFAAIGAKDFLTASHWARNKMSVYLPPFILALLRAEDS